MRISYDFNDLEAFLAVVELRSFHGAAQALNLSQSAVTRRIRKLENSLGVVLFERTTRKVTPTLAAKRFAERARPLLEEASASARLLVDETDRFEFQRNSIVTVATVPSAMPSLLVPALERFQKEKPGVRIKILDLLANAVVEAVSNGEADFGLCSIPSLDDMIEFDPIADDTFALAVREDDPLVSQSQLSWEGLSGRNLIVPLKGTGNRMLIDEAIARSGSQVHWTFEVSRTTTALELVKAGLGVAVLPDRSASDRQVRTVPLISPTIRRSIGLIRRQNVALRPVAQQFADICRDQQLG